jgi:hypothetical protein
MEKISEDRLNDFKIDPLPKSVKWTEHIKFIAQDLWSLLFDYRMERIQTD